MSAGSWIGRVRWPRRLVMAVALIGLVGSITASGGPASASNGTAAAGSRMIWAPIWRDDFTGTKGSPPAHRWIIDKGCGIAGGMAECDTDDPRNVSLDGQGHLDITARTTGSGHYTSARIRTLNEGFVPPQHGILRLSARIKEPAAPGGTGAGGLDAAFWTWASALLHNGKWPDSGEMDIVENYPVHADWDTTTLWCPGGGCGVYPETRIHAESSARDGKPLSDRYHDFAVVWQRDPDRVTWTIDGRAFLSATPRDTGKAGWVFDKPFFPLLSILVGGALGTPVLPATMSVDSVIVSLGVRVPSD